jgi:hypothetical protein
MEPYEEERRLCSTLLVYLGRLAPPQVQVSTLPSPCAKQSSTNAGRRVSDVVPEEDDTGLLLVRPREEELVLYGGCSKPKKPSGKKEKKIEKLKV